MLSERFRYDRKAIIPLNSVQNDGIISVKEKKYTHETVKCAVCNSNKFFNLSEKDKHGIKMNVVICEKCGLVQTNPRMDKESYNEFYNSEYRKINRGSTKPTEEYFLTEYYNGKKIYNYLGGVSGKFVVEIGTGMGGILKYFKEKHNKVYGVDIGKEYIEFGKNKGLDLEIGSIEKLKGKNKPDVVILSHVLEHISNPVEELKKLRGYLKEDSIVYIEVPGIKNLEKSYRRNFLRYLQLPHVYHFTLTSLKNCLKKSGYDLVMGNEYIRSVWRIGKEDNEFEKEFESTINYLKKLENNRFNIDFFKMILFDFIVYLLRKTKMKKIVQKLVS